MNKLRIKYIIDIQVHLLVIYILVTLLNVSLLLLF